MRRMREAINSCMIVSVKKMYTYKLAKTKAKKAGRVARTRSHMKEGTQGERRAKVGKTRDISHIKCFSRMRAEDL